MHLEVWIYAEENGEIVNNDRHHIEYECRKMHYDASIIFDTITTLTPHLTFFGFFLYLLKIQYIFRLCAYLYYTPHTHLYRDRSALQSQTLH